MAWHKLDGTVITIPIAEEISRIIAREKNQGIRIKACIGTDSQVKGDITEVATAVVFIRERSGGFMYFNSFKTSQKMTLKERMLLEVSKSIEHAYELCPLFDRENIEMEVHADINTDPNFKSNDSLKEAMGYILGMGYVFKAKPDAFASSSCANKVVH